MNSRSEALIKDMDLATTAIMDAKEGLYGIIKVNNEHDDSVGHLTTSLAYGGEQLCKVIAEKVEVLFAAIEEVEKIATPKPLARENTNALNDLNDKLNKLLSLTNVASSDVEYGDVDSTSTRTVFNMCYELASECYALAGELSGVQKGVAR